MTRLNIDEAVVRGVADWESRDLVKGDIICIRGKSVSDEYVVEGTVRDYMHYDGMHVPFVYIKHVGKISLFSGTEVKMISPVTPEVKPGMKISNSQGIFTLVLSIDPSSGKDSFHIMGEDFSVSINGWLEHEVIELFEKGYWEAV